jgi:hypothetical protein
MESRTGERKLMTETIIASSPGKMTRAESR